MPNSITVGFILPTWGLIKRSRLCASNNAAIGCLRQQEDPPSEATTTVNGGGESSESEQQQAAALAFARFWPIGFVKLLLTVGILNLNKSF